MAGGSPVPGSRGVPSLGGGSQPAGGAVPRMVLSQGRGVGSPSAGVGFPSRGPSSPGSLISGAGVPNGGKPLE